MLILSKIVTKVQLINSIGKECICVLRTFNNLYFKCQHLMHESTYLWENKGKKDGHIHMADQRITIQQKTEHNKLKKYTR